MENQLATTVLSLSLKLVRKVMPSSAPPPDKTVVLALVTKRGNGSSLMG